MSKLDVAYQAALREAGRRARSHKSTVPGLKYKIVKIQGEKAHYFSIYHVPSGRLLWDMPSRTKRIGDVVTLANAVLVEGNWDVPAERLDLAGLLHQIMGRFKQEVLAFL